MINQQNVSLQFFSQLSSYWCCAYVVYSCISLIQKNEQHTAFTITLEKDSINFHGAIGDVVSCKDIQSIHYYEQKLPAGKKQGAGEATSHYIVGDAKFDEIGKCRLIYILIILLISRHKQRIMYIFLTLLIKKITYTLYDKIKNLNRMKNQNLNRNEKWKSEPKWKIVNKKSS